MSDLERRALLGAAGLAGIAAMAHAVKAGPLTPPSGAVASSGKTLQEIADKVARTDAGVAEPRTPVSATTTPGNASYAFRITQSGSYYLTGNLSAGALSGIEIAAPRVTLDLCGFTITGSGVPAAAVGIFAASTQTSITVRNGRVTGFTSTGVSLAGTSSCVIDVQASFNLAGIAVSGSGSLVDRCQGNDNGGTGITAGPGAIVTLSHAQRNGGNGFALSSSSTATACVATSNTGDGFANGVCIGCFAGSNSDDGFVSCRTLDSCAASSNIGDGASSCSAIHRCFLFSNGGWGATSADLVTDTRIESNSDGGVSLGIAGAIHRCSVYQNGTATQNAGISGSGSRCVISHNVVAYGGPGIDTSSQSLVENNLVFASGSTMNISDALTAGGGSMVRANAVYLASGWGIMATTGCVVTGNIADGNTGGAFGSSGTPLVGPIVTTAAGMATATAHANFSV